MAIPDYQSLMLPLLKHAARGETRVPDVASELADEFGLTAEERDQLLPSGRQQVLNNRIHWAKFYMAKAGLIDQPKHGRFIASERGRELLARNPATVNLETLLEYPAFREFYRSSGSAPAGAKTEEFSASDLTSAQPVTPSQPYKKTDQCMAEKRWDVFISYKRESDQSDASILCDALEKAGVKCWIAPRDVAATQRAINQTGEMAGAGYDDAIPVAIKIPEQ